MIIWAIISTVIAITLLIALAHYRSQIKKNCQQLEVMQSHTTNQRLTAEVPYKEINEMVQLERIGFARIEKKDGKSVSMIFAHR